MNEEMKQLIEFDPKDGEKYEMEIVGVGKGIIEIVEVNNSLMILEPTQGHYPVEYAKKRSDLKFKKIET